MNRIASFTLFLVLLTCSTVFSQDKKKIDSLLIRLKTAQDTNRVMVLKNLAYNYRNEDPTKALDYANQAIDLAEDLDYTNGRYDSYMQKGLVYYNTGKPDSALKYFAISMAIAEQTGDSSQLTAIYSNLGNVYGDIGQNKKCLFYYQKSMLFVDEVKVPAQKGYTAVNIGTIYSSLEQHDSALVFYQNGLDILMGLDSTDVRLYIVYGNIGSSYMMLGDTLKAEHAYKESLRLGKMHENIRALGSAYGHLALIQFYKGSVDTAFVYFRKSIALNEQIEARLGISESCLHFGEAFIELGMYDSAAFYLNKGMSYAEEVHDFYTMDNFYKSLSQVYESKGQLDSALFYYKKLQDVRDTLFNLNKSNIVSEMQSELANERSLREIDLLKQKDEKKNLILYASIALGILLLLMVILAYNRFLVKKRSALLLEKQNTEIQEQKEIIEEKNKDVTDSIHYAKRIQNAILPSNDRILELFPSSWCFFVPKDIVSGDFYWFEEEGEYKLFGAIDCTGHGVPGALLSVVGHNLLGKALTDLKLVMPDKILAFLDGEIHKTLRHKDAMNENSVQDGMDIALCCYHEKSKTIYYSGAANPMYIFRGGELLEFKADKIMIGSGDSAKKDFTLHEIKVESGDEIIVFTDGYADQFGGPFGKKMKYKPFKEMLLSIQELSMEEQSISVTNSFKEWKKDFDQVDDVCVLAIRIG